MKITPVSSPAAIPPQGTPESVRTAKAVAAFNKGASSYDKPIQSTQTVTGTHSIDQNNISVEELSAIQTPESDKNVIEGTTESIETPVEQEVKPEPKVDPTLSRQFAQLARQEKALRAKQQQQDQALKAREEALKAREAELSGKIQFDPSKYVSIEQFKANPLKVMAETGLSYDELTQQILNVQPTDPRTEAIISRLEAKIAALEEGSKKAEESVREQQQQTYRAAVKQIESDVKNLVTMDPNFETIKATNSIRDVVELIERVYEKDGLLLSIEDAAQQVEDYLVDEALKLTRIGKIKSRYEQSAQKAQSKQQTQAQKPQTPPTTMKTLTNATSSTRQLSAKERAILAFRGELKS